MRSSWINQVDLSPVTHVLMTAEETQRQGLEFHAAQGKEHLEPPETGRDKEGFSPALFQARSYGHMYTLLHV